MTKDERDTPRRKGGSPTHADSESSLEKELGREEREGADSIGDVAADRNLSGSSSWTTLPSGSDSDRRRAEPASGGAGTRDDEQRHAADEIAARLRGRGVALTGRESGEELADLLDAVEQFEVVVERSGGDLMVDEPVGADSPIAPDDASFVLPARQRDETIAAYIGRITDAGARAAQARRRT
ncbi:MAG: hypothetical protein ACJ79S_13350 [Gemmatimonadaceae bacterium]